MPRKTKTNSLITALSSKNTVTQNGALSNSTAGSALVDFFGKAGALRGNDESEVVRYFSAAYGEDKTLALKTLFYSADARGGQGERRLFRVCFGWLAKNDEAVARKLLKHVPTYRRWDDVLESLENTPLEVDALKLVTSQFKKDVKAEKPTLLGKWLPSEQASSDNTKRLARKVRAHMDLSPRAYRKLLSGLRAKIGIVESQMCAGEWNEIDFSRVPSRAASLYKSAFNRHAPERYSAFLTKVEKGEAKINASVLYPYDIVRQIERHDGNEARTLEAQWKALPDYLADNPHNGLVVADVSGSMDSGMGDVRPVDVAVSLAIYFAERNEGAFKGHFMQFSDEAQFLKLTGSTLKEKVENVLGQRPVANTNLQAVFDLILTRAKAEKVPERDMPKAIYLVSDMQFDQCTGDNSATNLETIKAKYKAAGYKCPQIVFWCVNAHADSPVTVNDRGVCLVSGCSPSILKTVLSGKVVTPYDVMLNTVNVERYELIEA